MGGLLEPQLLQLDHNSAFNVLQLCFVINTFAFPQCFWTAAIEKRVARGPLRSA